MHVILGGGYMPACICVKCVCVCVRARSLSCKSERACAHGGWGRGGERKKGEREGVERN